MRNPFRVDRLAVRLQFPAWAGLSRTIVVVRTAAFDTEPPAGNRVKQGGIDTQRTLGNRPVMFQCARCYTVRCVDHARGSCNPTDASIETPLRRSCGACGSGGARAPAFSASRSL